MDAPQRIAAPAPNVRQAPLCSNPHPTSPLDVIRAAVPTCVEGMPVVTADELILAIELDLCEGLSFHFRDLETACAWRRGHENDPLSLRKSMRRQLAGVRVDVLDMRVHSHVACC